MRTFSDWKEAFEIQEQKIHLEDLVGALIVEAGATVDEGDRSVWPFLKIRMADGSTKILQIGSDTMGMKPGHIFIDEGES